MCGGTLKVDHFSFRLALVWTFSRTGEESFLGHFKESSYTFAARKTLWICFLSTSSGRVVPRGRLQQNLEALFH